MGRVPGAVFFKIMYIGDRCYVFKKYFHRNLWRKYHRLFAQTSASFSKKLIITLVFEKDAFYAEKWQKSQKIAIMTSTPGHPVWRE
jgi:hypothetical protein